MSKTSFRLAAVASAAALVLTACGDDSGGDEDADAGTGDDGGNSITVGIKVDQPGLGLQDGENYTGMDVDVARHVLGELGYEEGDITFQEAPTPQREQLLKTGQVDMIFATYSITDERAGEVDFAGPYFVAGQDLLVPVDSDVTGLNDTLDGKLLCTVGNSTSAQNVKEAIPGVELQEQTGYSECAEQVANGTLDVLTTDDTILAGYAAQDAYAGKLKVVGDVFSEENYGVGLPEGSEDCEEINEVLAAMWEDGTMDTIIEDNFGASGYQPNSELNPPEPGGYCS